MNEQRIQSIKDQMKSLVQRMMENGWDSTQEIVDLISQVIKKAQGQINDLRSQDQQKPQPPSPPTPPDVNPALHYDTRLLWILAGRNPQAFTSYLNSFPTPATSQIASNPDVLNRTIAELSRIMPPGANEQIEENGIPHAPLQSSNVWGALYDNKTGKMRVRFQGGSEYEYDGIPQNIFRAFINGQASAKTKGENQYGRWWPNKNPSLGAALNQYIKEGGFNYRRIR